MIKIFTKKRLYFLIMLLGILYGIPCVADTPATARVSEGAAQKIECSIVGKDESLGSEKVFVKSGTYHYQVYLPRDYYKNKNKRYPSLFIASPGGNAGMENVEKIMTERKWIVIMLVESKNDSPKGVAEGNFLAAHDDAVKRFRLQEGMKFATGLSGGARRQSLNAGLRPGFAGIILQGAGFIQKPGSQGYYMESVKKNPALCVYGIFGVTDPNRIETGIIDAMLPKSTLRRFANFNGGHEWAPPERMEEALDWITFNALMNLDTVGEGTAFLSNTIDDAMTAASQSGAARIKGAFALNDLAKILEQRNLKDQEAFKAQSAKFDAALKKLNTEPDIRNELESRTEYEAIAADESITLAQRQKPFMIKTNCAVPATEEAAALCSIDDGNTPQAFMEIAKRYDACAKKYSSTVYGRKAIVKSKIVAVKKK